MSKVEIKNVSFSFGEVKVLNQVNLTIKDNDFLGIIGPNGGGKTTLLKIILGLLEPDQGEVWVFGQPPQKGRWQIGYVPQRMNFDRDFPISVWEVVLMGCLSRRGMLQGFTDEDKAEVKDALEKVGMLKFKDHPIGQLSQGQQQRVFIARALASSPKLLLLDEPTASVDPAVQKEFYSLLTLLNQHMPVVLVSHDIGVISSCVNKVACLNRELHYHDAKEMTQDDLNKTYGICAVEMLAHGVPHRVLKEHKH